MLANTTANYAQVTIPAGQLATQNPGLDLAGPGPFLWEFDFEEARIGDRCLAQIIDFTPNVGVDAEENIPRTLLFGQVATANGKAKLTVSPIKNGGGDIDFATTAIIMRVTLLANTGEAA